jgi:hypothetical protein
MLLAFRIHFAALLFRHPHTSYDNDLPYVNRRFSSDPSQARADAPQNPAGFPSQILGDYRVAETNSGVCPPAWQHTLAGEAEPTSVAMIQDNNPTSLLQANWQSDWDDASPSFQPQADISIFQQSSFSSEDSWMTDQTSQISVIDEETGGPDQGASVSSSSVDTFQSQFSEATTAALQVHLIRPEPPEYPPETLLSPLKFNLPILIRL